MCAAWSRRAPEHLSEVLAKFEAGLPSGWLPHRLAGTKVLRRCADGPGVCKKAFSLILADRSLDVELSSERECARYRAALERLVLDAKL